MKGGSSGKTGTGSGDTPLTNRQESTMEYRQRTGVIFFKMVSPSNDELGITATPKQILLLRKGQNCA
jgi:hypothetical protein